MNDGADFLTLYKELGVGPECDPDSFKRAYRRRVSGLHPDRAGTDAGGEDTLKTLNYAYSAALEFHRAHGRFPGSTVKTAPSAGSLRTEMAQTCEAPIEDAPAATASRWRLMAGLGLTLALTALLMSANDDAPDVAHVASSGTVSAAATGGSLAANDKPLLKLGMSPDEVIAVIGPPFSSDHTGQQWLYGASWVRVACGQLVDWYSSPLQPLDVARERPGPGDTVADFRPRRHCPGNE
nr:J domain-containing protein [uncultured Pseudoxanthomonas sp.]